MYKATVMTNALETDGNHKSRKILEINEMKNVRAKIAKQENTNNGMNTC